MMRSGDASVAASGGGGGGGGGAGVVALRPDCAVAIVATTKMIASSGKTFFMAPTPETDGFGRREFYRTAGAKQRILAAGRWSCGAAVSAKPKASLASLGLIGCDQFEPRSRD